MIQNIRLLIQIIPLILEIVKMVDAAVPESGKGKEKLEYVRDVLETTEPEIKNIWSQVEFIINRTVSLYKVTGIFRKS